MSEFRGNLMEVVNHYLGMLLTAMYCYHHYRIGAASTYYKYSILNAARFECRI